MSTFKFAASRIHRFELTVVGQKAWKYVRVEIRQFPKESLRCRLRARYKGEPAHGEPQTRQSAHRRLACVVPGKVGVKLVLFKSGSASSVVRLRQE